jgi:hypothetical protein
MRPGRSTLGVMVGIMLGLGVVALAGSGLNLHAMQTASAQPNFSQTNGNSTQSATIMQTASAQPNFSQTNGSSTWFVTATNASQGSVALHGNGTTFGSMVGKAPLSQVKSIAKQPIALTGFVLLPVFAAFLLGFVFYKVSRIRNEKEERPETA